MVTVVLGPTAAVVGGVAVVLGAAAAVLGATAAVRTIPFGVETEQAPSTSGKSQRAATDHETLRNLVYT